MYVSWDKDQTVLAAKVLHLLPGSMVYVQIDDVHSENALSGYIQLGLKNIS